MSQKYTSCSGTSLGGTVPYVEPHADAKELIPILKLAAETSVLVGQVTKLRFQEFFSPLSFRILHTTKIVRKNSHENINTLEFIDIFRALDKELCIKKLYMQSKIA